MTTEPEVPLSAEEIAELWKRIDDAATSDSEHGTTWIDLNIWQRVRATIAAKEARITELEWERIHETDRANLNADCAESLESRLAGVLSMSTCTKCRLRAAPTAYHVGGGPEPLKLVYRCPNEECGYCVPPPMSAKIESLESQLRDANRRAFDLNNELGATQNAAQAERVELEAKVRERRGYGDQIVGGEAAGGEGPDR